MNWEAAGAIGEILGAIGVLVTLIYFGVQLGKTQAGLTANAMSARQQSSLLLRDKLETSASLVVKANSGQGLSEEEKFRLLQISQMANDDAFIGYLRVKAIQYGTEEILVRNFAGFLYDNPGIRDCWEESETKGYHRIRDLTSRPGPGVEWVAAVRESLVWLDKDDT